MDIIIGVLFALIVLFLVLGLHPHQLFRAVRRLSPRSRLPAADNKKPEPPHKGRRLWFCFWGWSRAQSRCLQQDVLQDKENGQHIHEGADLLLLGLAGDHIDDGPGDDADGDALRDAVGSGIARMARKAGMPSLGSEKSILMAEPIM